MTTVLFVCSGNTCRSPMAACLFSAACARLGRDDLTAMSAGTSAMEGMPASEGARRAMERRGLSLRGHRSRQVTARELMDASLVVCMSARHARWIEDFYPRASVTLRYFEPPVADPAGYGDNVYEQTARELETRINWLVESSGWLSIQRSEPQ